MAMMIMRFYRCSFDVKDLFIHLLVNYMACAMKMQFNAWPLDGTIYP